MKPSLKASCCPSGTFLFLSRVSRLSTSKPLSRVRKPCNVPKTHLLQSRIPFLNKEHPHAARKYSSVYFLNMKMNHGSTIFFYIPHTFIKDGVKLSDSRGRLKADCVLLVLLLKVLKPLLWTHTLNRISEIIIIIVILNYSQFSS